MLLALVAELRAHPLKKAFFRGICVQLKMRFNHLDSENMSPQKFKEDVEAYSKRVYELQDSRVRDIGQGKAFGLHIDRSARPLRNLSQKGSLPSTGSADYDTPMVTAVEEHVYKSRVYETLAQERLI